MFPRLLIALHFLLLAASSLRAMESVPVDMLYRNWRTREGLPQDHIRVMAGTRDGFLWLGTDSGLARFDGVRFKTFGLHEGLGAATVQSMYEAQDGSLWVGTLGGGLSMLREGKLQRTYGSADGLPSTTVLTVAEDDQGRLVVSTREGLSRLEGGRFIPFDPPGRKDRQAVKSMFRDHEGTLWVCVANLEIWRWKAGQWAKGSGGGPEVAVAFCEDREKRLWIGDSERRLWCRNPDGWKSHVLPLPVGEINMISSAPDGTIWISMVPPRRLWFSRGQNLGPEHGQREVPGHRGDGVRLAGRAIVGGLLHTRLVRADTTQTATRRSGRSDLRTRRELHRCPQGDLARPLSDRQPGTRLLSVAG
ncbi:MAG: two-component regulator propeller domain-containing protein [Luteolibacter sp.]